MSKKHLFAFLLLVSLFMFTASCSKYYEESPLPDHMIQLIDGGSFGMYRGAAGIAVTGEGKTFEITTSDGLLGNWFQGSDKTAAVSVSGDAQGPEENKVYLLGYGGNEENPFGTLDADSAVIRIIIYEQDHITGYALAAFWDKQGPEQQPVFCNGKLLKAVEIRTTNGAESKMTIQEVNELLDQEEKRYSLENYAGE